MRGRHNRRGSRSRPNCGRRLVGAVGCRAPALVRVVPNQQRCTPTWPSLQFSNINSVLFLHFQSPGTDATSLLQFYLVTVSTRVFFLSFVIPLLRRDIQHRRYAPRHYNKQLLSRPSLHSMAIQMSSVASWYYSHDLHKDAYPRSGGKETDPIAAALPQICPPDSP